MWAVPTSQSLFFSTLLGRVQFRSIDFADQKEVVSTSIKNYSRMKATDDMIGAVRRFKNLGSIWPYLNDKIQEKELRQFFCLNSFLGCSTTISFYLDRFV